MLCIYLWLNLQRLASCFLEGHATPSLLAKSAIARSTSNFDPEAEEFFQTWLLISMLMSFVSNAFG